MSTLRAIAGGAALLASALPLSAQPQAILPVVDEFATVADQLGQPADLAVTLRDERGAPVLVRELVSGERPIVLNLGYFACPSACGPVFSSLLDGLANAELLPGRDVDVLTISIDVREGPELAAQKQSAALDLLGAPEAARFWRFLTGDAEPVRRLADSVGFRYRFVEGTSQIDHPPVVTVLTADGRVSRYLDGQVMTPATLRNAVIEAGDGKVGTFLERLFVSCLTFDSTRGEYSVAAMTVMRVGGILTVIALGTMIFVLWRRERHRTAVAAT